MIGNSFYEYIRNHPSHRSINSGFELALKRWVEDYPDFAINYGNYSWSGAIASFATHLLTIKGTIVIALKTYRLLGTKNQCGGNYTQLNEDRPKQTQMQVKPIDALFINMGGNDAGFGEDNC